MIGEIERLLTQLTEAGHLRHQRTLILRVTRLGQVETGKSRARARAWFSSCSFVLDSSPALAVSLSLNISIRKSHRTALERGIPSSGSTTTTDRAPFDGTRRRQILPGLEVEPAERLRAPATNARSAKT
jgi:hypothetical protein